MIERREFESLFTEVERDSVSLRIHSLCSRGEPGKDSPVVLVPGQGASGVSMLPTARLLPRGATSSSLIRRGTARATDLGVR